MTNEELKAAIRDFNNAYNYEEDNEEHVKLFEGRYPDIFEYWRELDIITQAARELLQLKDGTHPDMVMVNRAELDLRYEQGRRDELNKLALAATQKGKREMTKTLDDIKREMDYLQDKGLLMVWQPIETAPKDGTDIIVNMPQVESGCTFIYWKDGWRLTYDGKFLCPHVTSPTHWMPLPVAPKGETK